jgi:hypothetical protein
MPARLKIILDQGFMLSNSAAPAKGGSGSFSNFMICFGRQKLFLKTCNAYINWIFELGRDFMPKERLIIIGGNAAGMSAASQVRRQMPEWEIISFEESPHTSYSS